MKKLIISASILGLMSNVLYAGGDIAPVVVDEPTTAASMPLLNNDFYVGLGYAQMTMKNKTQDLKVVGNTYVLSLGYNINEYLAIEGRYNAALGDVRSHDIDVSWDMSNIALYLKPQYTVDNTDLTVYGLFGYGQTELDNSDYGVSTNLFQWGSGTSHTESGFQWGVGAKYAVTDDFDVYADYTSLYDDDGFDAISNTDSVTAENVTVGVLYKF